MDPTSENPIERLTRRFAGPAVCALVGAVMLWWSWGTWTDVIIDVGRELYVPWRLSEGEVLYRDIVSYFNGPLSPYLHALLFKIFGVSLRTLVIFNVCVIAVLSALIYSLISRTAGRLAATTATCTFLILFAFAQYLLSGNYNYVTPYSYELSHGITLTAAAIWCLDRWNCSMLPRRRLWLAACGVLVGLVLLTKAEVMLAAAGAIAVGFAAVQWNRRGRALRSDVVTLITAALGPVVLALGLLMLAMPPARAVQGVLGSWRWLGDRTLLDLPYFKEMAGTLDVGDSLISLALWTIGYVVVFGTGIALGTALRPPAGGRAAISIAWAAGLLVLGWFKWREVNWYGLIRPVPLLLLVAAGFIVVRLYKSRRRDLVLPLVLIGWALLMLAKMPLYAHIHHYGFALGMPATIVCVALLIGWLPRLLDRRGQYGHALRATVIAALAVTIGVHGGRMYLLWGQKDVVVSRGADAFLADQRALYVNAILDLLAQTPADATVVVVPEGLTINYLARRVNPTGQLNFTPPAIIMYGEDAILRAFQENPPDYLVVTGVDTKEYGRRFFGFDYARDVGKWIDQNYQSISVVGEPPFKGSGFGIALLKRTAVTTRPTTGS